MRWEVYEVEVRTRGLKFLNWSLYRVFHVSTTFLIWLKMTLKCIGDMKERHFYNHKDPPFDMKHQLKSVDHVPVLKIDQKLTI